MKFIKVGNTIINPVHITWAEILPDKTRVRIALANIEQMRIFEGIEAEALIKFLIRPRPHRRSAP